MPANTGTIAHVEAFGLLGFIGSLVVALLILRYLLLHPSTPAAQSHFDRDLPGAAQSLFDRGDLPGALDAVQTAIELAELAMPVGRVQLANLHVLQGRILEALPPSRCAGGTCTEHAANAYRRALQHTPMEMMEVDGGSKRAASDALERISSRLTGASAPYVEALFDEYAETFDDSLGRLGYLAPSLLAQAVSNALSSSHHASPVGSMLDAGCGTGLAGIHLRPLTQRLVGVDLSAGMIQKAKARESVYDELVQAELLSFLQAHRASNREPFDAIVAADVLNYLAESMSDVMSAAAHALVDGGLMAFTLEAPTDANLSERTSTWQWTVLPSGRYAHNASWVAEEASRHGLELLSRTPLPKLRMDGGKVVPGTMMVLVRRRLVV
eukprot:CAMPEP_0119326408 /NCGR_PEP_ID=MMETSP1333-20130426/68320_1 /TAXON_ID=418940 /ORGANISM="Scyphosphaera apsteinii, Strain RCC1455" /LENGTH=382 /DNA_ID=CAMNT_0007334713 /DNA_START=60 /DNA_END=1209 /DNA_ORIENTATION=+